MKLIGLVKSDAQSVLTRALRKIKELESEYKIQEDERIQRHIDKYANKFFFPKKLTREQAIADLDKDGFAGVTFWRPYFPSSISVLNNVVSLCCESIESGNGKVLINEKITRILPRK